MLPAADNSFRKEERICGKTAVSTLMQKGRWGHCGVLKYCFLAGNGMPFNRIMVSVPKKNFKRAVKRNLLKRRLRESYRALKHGFAPEYAADILFFYNCTEIKDSVVIKADMAAALQEIGNRLSSK